MKEKLKAQIEELEPEVKRLWDINRVDDAREKASCSAWCDVNRRIEHLRQKLALLEEIEKEQSKVEFTPPEPPSGIAEEHEQSYDLRRAVL